MTRFGRLYFVWFDPWERRHGLAVEVTVGRTIYSLAVGFGRGISARKGHA